MNELQEVLQISAKLYTLLGEHPPIDDRDSYVEDINNLLDLRGQKVEALKITSFTFNKSEKSHVMLYELDKGIQERLLLIMGKVKEDLRTVQQSKKQEQQYSNPYSHLQTIDGMYYDKKK